MLFAVLLASCSRQPDLSALNIFQTKITEPPGTNLTVFTETGGVATPLLSFTVGDERPTLFVQTELPGGTMPTLR